MYSAEPLPHFVDEYLAYLYEAHPTSAAFDGVHLHDDLLEDLGRQAIDAQVRALGGFARRLAAIDPARLTDTERLERPALESNIRVAAVRARAGPDLGAEPPALRRHPGHQPGRRRRCSTTRPLAERARRVHLEAAPGAAAHAVGARQHQGPARHLSSRSASRACAARCASSTTTCRARSATWATCTCSATSPTRPPKRPPRSARYDRVSRERPRAASKGSFRLGREKFEQKFQLDEGITLPRRSAAGDCDARAAGDAGGVPPRRRRA